jgi:hypothetical protein
MDDPRYPQSIYESPVDRHIHYGDRGRAECAVCCLEAERDRLRGLREQLHGDVARIARKYREARDERDRLRAVVDAQAASLARLKEFAESEILDRVSADLGAKLRGQLDVSPTMGGMTPDEEHAFYANPAHREPQGSPVRRRGDGTPAMGGDDG